MVRHKGGAGMSMSDFQRRQADRANQMIERLWKLLQLIVVGLLAWTVEAVSDIKTDVAVLKAEMTAIKQGTADRYYGHQAASDFAQVWRQLETNSKLLLSHESRLDVVEQQIVELRATMVTNRLSNGESAARRRNNVETDR